jgi:subtilase family serine protease
MYRLSAIAVSAGQDGEHTPQMLKFILSTGLAAGSLFGITHTTARVESAPSTVVNACGAPQPQVATCNAEAPNLTEGQADGGPLGYSPANLQAAYNLIHASATAGKGETVAVVEAYHDPRAAADLNIYRHEFHLAGCTPSDGCMRQVTQAGNTSWAGQSLGWTEETSLDLDMVSAICPNCHILLVEANAATITDLGPAVDEAVSLHANVVTISWGIADASDATYGKYFDHPGVPITASAGDHGYGVEYPASSHYVTAVGGTSLVADGGTARGWNESAWSGSGSGCSSRNSQPSWQANAATGCSMRAVVDVSADANPYTGVAAYDSYPAGGQTGWVELGGTSAAAPMIAAVYALAGNAAKVTFGSYPYSHVTGLNPVTTGSNGNCHAEQLCTARSGWNGPAGLGSPDGTSAF